ncbi:unnamed protein product [Dicrocoelium dendriticum]|nr:unnamed protein product [Dicrocoelium dendriticum]
MAVIRQKARLVLMSGTEGLNRLTSSSEYTQLKSNFLAWLSSGTSGASLVKVTAKYKDGDVLLITRDDNFNVASVQQSLTEGKNSAIIAYAGSTQQTADSATELMSKLEIGYSPHRINYSGRNLLLAPFIETTQFIPKPYVLQLALQSWKYFRTVDLVGEIEPEESAQPAFQEALTKLIEKHKTFFTETAICDRNQYVSDDDTEMAYENYNRLLLLQNGSSIEVAPGYARAPGSVLSSEKPTSYTVKFNVDLSGSFYPMGGYAKPGEAFRYKVLENSATDLTGFRIRINPQTDVIRKNVMKRWFVVTSVKDLENEGEFASPFGGPIVIEIPAKGSISIRFENVYRYAWFDLRDTKTMNSWETDRKKYRGVPFVMVVGNDMISMLDTSISTTWDAERLKWCINYFDNVIKIMHNYRGTNSETDRMQVFVTDVQLSAGWGHSGYPWMGYVPWTEDFGNIDEIKKGHIIGIPHEIGHNLQVQQITFTNGTEVSNNAYIPVAHYYLLGLPAYTKGYTPGWSDDDEKELLALWRGNKYIGVGVSHYNYFARSFSPALVGNVMNEAYHANTSLDKEEDKVNFWIQHLCSESGHDLVPFNRMWHFPISDETVTLCGKYPCFFPEDELTAQVPDLVKKQLDAYGKTCSRTKPNDVAFKNDIKQRIDKLKSQIIFIEG